MGKERDGLRLGHFHKLIRFFGEVSGCQGMAQWTKLSLVAIQQMIKDEFHAENWMPTEASGSASREL